MFNWTKRECVYFFVLPFFISIRRVTKWLLTCKQGKKRCRSNLNELFGAWFVLMWLHIDHAKEWNWFLIFFSVRVKVKHIVPFSSHALSSIQYRLCTNYPPLNQNIAEIEHAGQWTEVNVYTKSRESNEQIAINYVVRKPLFNALDTIWSCCRFFPLSVHLNTFQFMRSFSSCVILKGHFNYVTVMCSLGPVNHTC